MSNVELCRHDDDRIVIEYVENSMRHVLYECSKCKRTIEHTFDDKIDEDWGL